MSENVREYNGESITITYDVRRCIHAAECTRGLPNVFDSHKRPWVNPDAADADAIAEVIMRCPTGALHFQRHDQGPAEPLPDANTITVTADGPLYLRGDIEITTPDGTRALKDTRVALCRCGATSNKPFCDGSHARVGFQDAGTGFANRLKPVDPAARGPLRITLAANGPLLLEGVAEVRSADGQTKYVGSKGALCRCGSSRSKPFCDGSHARVGFTSE